MEKAQTLDWEFTTVIKAAAGCRRDIPKYFANHGCKRIALITDKGLINAGVVDRVLEAFGEGAVKIIGTFDQVRQDNDTRDINDCAHWYKSLNADGLLAVGGGSVLDTAKCVKVMLGMGVDDINQLVDEHGVIYYTRPEAKPLDIMHISIPTTAGTGAEVSQGAALYDEENQRKIVMFHQFMNSDFAFLDPELTVSLPPKLTAEPAFDALSHAIESFFSTSSNSIADAFALRSARLIMDNLPIAVKEPNNLDVRMNLQTASSMSCIAVSSALSATPIHNLADAVGPHFRIAHGLANAVYMPIVMRHLRSHYLPRIRTFAEALGLATHSKQDTEIFDEVLSQIVALQHTCNIPTTLPIKVESNNISELRSLVKEDPAGMLFPLSDEVIDKCLKESLSII